MRLHKRCYKSVRGVLGPRLTSISLNPVQPQRLWAGLPGAFLRSSFSFPLLPAQPIDCRRPSSQGGVIGYKATKLASERLHALHTITAVEVHGDLWASCSDLFLSLGVPSSPGGRRRERARSHSATGILSAQQPHPTHPPGLGRSEVGCDGPLSFARRTTMAIVGWRRDQPIADDSLSRATNRDSPASARPCGWQVATQGLGETAALLGRGGAARSHC